MAALTSKPIPGRSHDRPGVVPVWGLRECVLGLVTVGALLFVFGSIGHTSAGDWPMYGYDAKRSGSTRERLPAKLNLRWIYQPVHSPQPAWPRSDLAPYDYQAERYDKHDHGRMPFDRAYHTVIADGTLFFGSSADGKIYALDAVTGYERWTFFTGAPARFAPAVADGRVFVTSDDGYLYCLSAETGELQWKRRGGPTGQMVLGNQRMVSRWPARGGPVVAEGVVYFAAGIWPTEGVFVYALRADTGEVIWSNTESGRRHMRQPKEDSLGSGPASQGYLVITENNLLVPTGRSLPAAYGLKDGQLQYYFMWERDESGGMISGAGSSTTMSSGGFFFNTGRYFSAKTGVLHRKIGYGAFAGLPDGFVHGSSNGLTVYRWGAVDDEQELDRRGRSFKTRKLEAVCRVEDLPANRCVIVADKRVVAGGDRVITLVDLDSRKAVWSAEVDGVVWGLAVANGSLYASTDQGTIYCFDGAAQRSATIISRKPATNPYGENRKFAQAAEEILSRTRISEGYCLDLGCGDGALAYELAKRTGLHIYSVEPNAAKAEVARKKLDAAGLYGVRVTVHHRPLDATRYPKHFANLIVSSESVTHDAGAVDLTEVRRLQRPYGGTLCVGVRGAMQIDVRGSLDGAGSWTHQYANAANTTCSTDQVAGPLRPLWYRQIEQRMPNRHGRGPAPLFLEGRVFSLGMNSLVAIDAYNGRVLWEYPVPGMLQPLQSGSWMGTSGTHGPYCVSETGIYLRRDDYCLRIDQVSGKLLGKFAAPEGADGKPGIWGFIARDGDLLFGTLANTEHVVNNAYSHRIYNNRWHKGLDKRLTESTTLFAIDAVTGKLRWRYDAIDSIRHNAIAIAGQRVYLIDRPLALLDRYKKPEHTSGHPTGVLVSLDAATGEPQWKAGNDIYGTTLLLSEKYNALLMCYQPDPAPMALLSELGGRMTVFDTGSGRRIWEKKASYVTRPLINDQTIYAQGGAWDLLSGEDRPFNFRRGYGCGILAGGANLMVFRSETLGYFDLTKNERVEHFTGIRLGCWINAIPVGGLVMVQDATDDCICSYQNKTWVALQRDQP